MTKESKMKKTAFMTTLVTLAALLFPLTLTSCSPASKSPDPNSSMEDVSVDSSDQEVSVNFPGEDCLSCHDAEELKVKTVDSTVLVDAKGKTVNPHDLPSNEDHASIQCTNCHTEHSAESAVEKAPKECLSCHHAGVYECNTCHE